MSEGAAGFAGRIVRWQRAHGRNSLPWQHTRDPYRIWLSEIMLQQTQVATVLAYYARFLERFPDVRSLAAAGLDEVYALWSGLGYYSRARNLHDCAREVVVVHGGEFPHRAQLLATLPGIGRSTAAAIASICFGERAAILDGNVKRVLTRLLGFDSDLSGAAAQRALWAHAQALLPRRSTADAMSRYTQGLMDLGATVCLPRNPSCALCPVADICVARRAGNPQAYPVKSRKLKRTAQSLWLLQAHAPGGAVWLEKRPATGIWAGLYCLPVFESREALLGAVPPRAHERLQDHAPFLHVLTHKDLHLHPVAARVERRAMKHPQGAWFDPQDLSRVGLPAPVRRLLAQRAPPA